MVAGDSSVTWHCTGTSQLTNRKLLTNDVKPDSCSTADGKRHTRAELASADIAVHFFKNMLPHMKHAVKLAEVLDKDHVDKNICFEAEEISTANQMVSAAKSSITGEEHCSSNQRTVLSGYNAKLMAEQAEDNLRLRRARDGIELEDIKKQEECRTANARATQEAQLKME